MNIVFSSLFRLSPHSESQTLSKYQSPKFQVEQFLEARKKLRKEIPASSRGRIASAAGEKSDGSQQSKTSGKGEDASESDDNKRRQEEPKLNSSHDKSREPLASISVNEHNGRSGGGGGKASHVDDIGNKTNNGSFASINDGDSFHGVARKSSASLNNYLSSHLSTPPSNRCNSAASSFADDDVDCHFGRVSIPTANDDDDDYSFDINKCGIMKEDFDPRRRLSTNSKNSYRSFILENSFFDGLLDAAGGDEEEEVEKKGGKRRSSHDRLMDKKLNFIAEIDEALRLKRANRSTSGNSDAIETSDRSMGGSRKAKQETKDRGRKENVNAEVKEARGSGMKDVYEKGLRTKCDEESGKDGVELKNKDLPPISTFSNRAVSPKPSQSVGDDKIDHDESPISLAYKKVSPRRKGLGTSSCTTGSSIGSLKGRSEHSTTPSSSAHLVTSPLVVTTATNTTTLPSLPTTVTPRIVITSPSSSASQKTSTGSKAEVASDGTSVSGAKSQSVPKSASASPTGRPPKSPPFAVPRGLPVKSVATQQNATENKKTKSAKENKRLMALRCDITRRESLLEFERLEQEIAEDSIAIKHGDGKGDDGEEGGEMLVDDVIEDSTSVDVDESLEVFKKRREEVAEKKKRSPLSRAEATSDLNRVSQII